MAAMPVFLHESRFYRWRSEFTPSSLTGGLVLACLNLKGVETMYRLSVRRWTTIFLAAASATILTLSSFAQKTQPTTAYMKSGAVLERARIEVTLFRFMVNTQSRD